MRLTLRRDPKWVRIARREFRGAGKWISSAIWLTHFGPDGKFPEAPLFEAAKEGVEWDVSTISGVHTVEEAAMWTRRREAHRKDALRFFFTADLYASSYMCLATPTTNIPGHVSLYAPISHLEDEAGARAWWADPERVTLDAIAQVAEARGVRR